MRTGERGAALLEALIAMAILAGAGVALVGVLGSAIQREQGWRDREQQTNEAQRVLTATALLSRGDLELRLGRRTIGEFVVAVTRPEPTLYRIAVAEASAPDVELLVTVLYRSVSP